MHSLRNYALVTGTYWAFTLTDGALRTLILFHLHDLGYSPLQLATLFVLYEFFGVVTNLVGGYLGARFGLERTLFAGLFLQIVACASLGLLSDRLSLGLVMGAQALSGIAKDLTKMSSKSYVKLVAPSSGGRGLLRWVSLITGSKNALKGAGFFLGGWLLLVADFRIACLGMAGLLLAALVGAVFSLPKIAGKTGTKFRSVFSRDPRINWLSAARVFLFGSRDVWFVVALPVFLATTLGWAFHEVGAFLALWIVGYGAIQSAAPGFAAPGGDPGGRHLVFWAGALLLPLAGLTVLLDSRPPTGPELTFLLAVFGAIFAANSALHSFLIVHYAEEEKVSQSVGFYYMANAAGRLMGTVLSGWLFQYAGSGVPGLQSCVLASLVFVVVSLLLATCLARSEVRVALKAA